MIRTVIQDSFNFLRKPNDIQIRLGFKKKVLFLLVILGFELILSYTFIFPLMDVFGEVVKLKTERIDYDSGTLFQSLLIFVLLVPLLEEMIFRKILRFKGLKTKIIPRKKWDRIFPIFVYVLAIAFGFLHITNYLNDNLLFYILSPFIILTQLFGGLMITFIRVRLSFIWGVAYHFVWNLIFIILLPSAFVFFSSPFTVSTSNYSIQVTEKVFFKTKDVQRIKIDSLEGKIRRIDIKQYSMQHLLDTIYGNQKYYVDDFLMDMKFKSNTGMDKLAFLELIKKEYTIQ